MMSDQPIPAGVLLGCVTCTVRILVLSSAASASAIVCCRQPMHVVPPLWCGAVDRASNPRNLVAGRLYQDRVSGFQIRCKQILSWAGDRGRTPAHPTGRMTSKPPGL